MALDEKTTPLDEKQPVPLERLTIHCRNGDLYITQATARLIPLFASYLNFPRQPNAPPEYTLDYETHTVGRLIDQVLPKASDYLQVADIDMSIIERVPFECDNINNEYQFSGKFAPCIDVEFKTAIGQIYRDFIECKNAIAEDRISKLLVYFVFLENEFRAEFYFNKKSNYKICVYNSRNKMLFIHATNKTIDSFKIELDAKILNKIYQVLI